MLMEIFIALGVEITGNYSRTYVLASRAPSWNELGLALRRLYAGLCRERRGRTVGINGALFYIKNGSE